MSTYYSFYNPNTFEEVESGHYAFYGILDGNSDIENYAIEKCSFYDGFCLPVIIGILDRDTAEKLQDKMNDGSSLFTDLMDKCHSECIIYKIE